MGKQWNQWQTLFWGAPKSLQMVIAAKTLKDAKSNKSILKETKPKYSLAGLMLKLKLQYFGHLMRLPCPSTIPGIYSNSCPSSQWCHPTISSSVIPFSSGLQSFPASGNFPKSQFFASGGQRIGVFASASVLPLNIQDWFPLGWTGWISLQSKGLSSVFSNMTVQ